jgi:hypothetical protein
MEYNSIIQPLTLITFCISIGILIGAAIVLYNNNKQLECLLNELEAKNKRIKDFLND